MKRTLIYLLLVFFSVSLLLATTSACASSEPEGEAFDATLLVRDPAQGDKEINPGLYCLTATEEEGLFELLGESEGDEDLIRSQVFASRAWVEVRTGETLRYKGSYIESYEERDRLGCQSGRLSNGFFLIGMDLFPGILTVRGLDKEDPETWVCEVYKQAHDPEKEGPDRSYEFDYTQIFIEVEEGEFIYLWHAEAYVPPS